MNEEPRLFNRDLSWIDFNSRVLDEGLKAALPGLDRMKFLSIVSSNFDEFFMIRVAAIKRALKARIWFDPAGYSPEALLKEISEKVHAITARQYACLLDEVLPGLAGEGLLLVRPEFYTPEDKDYLESLFQREIFPLLTPLRAGEDELPSMGNRICAAFYLSREEHGGLDEKKEGIAIVQLPASPDRVVWLPDADGKKRWALLEDIIIHWGASLFFGYEVREELVFKLARDADFSVDEERDHDFIAAMEEVLAGREYSMPVRMVCGAHDAASPGKLKDELAGLFSLGARDIYEVPEFLELDAASLSDLDAAGIPGLKEKAWRHYLSPAFPEEETLWDRIRTGDVLLHLPYHSFDPVLRFFQDAADDPDVVSIKTTLYRTGGDSPVVKALERAALNGKQVTAVVELKARFDEERNIAWAQRLEKAGGIVIYGLSHLKIHAKAALILRREKTGISRYVYLSTGNFNDRSATLYGDLGLFTAQEEIAYDAGLFFNMITGYSLISGTAKLMIAPLALKHRLLGLIEREAGRSTPEAPGLIMAKMNSLADADVIKALYRASQAGVSIRLNVRGICMLVPGVKGLSENIEVVSIIDRYLEHSRIFYFSDGGRGEVYLSSADWMTRNLERRVELMFPVLQEDIKKEVISILGVYFRDNCQSSFLDGDGTWKRVRQGKAGPFRAQEYFFRAVKDSSDKLWAPRQEFIVRRNPPQP
ncbi:MAG: polyphosphate kinase 1 [Spirochaetaceae bacterium]|jgi:polyphosphate kinase|nr:polyphosphate kinase 1 [Spirochaetaceae bacterium]